MLAQLAAAGRGAAQLNSCCCSPSIINVVPRVHDASLCSCEDARCCGLWTVLLLCCADGAEVNQAQIRISLKPKHREHMTRAIRLATKRTT
jgi:hypothetical protein